MVLGSVQGVWTGWTTEVMHASVSDPSVHPRWLSITDACKYISMSYKTLMQHVLNDEIYGTKKGGKWYIDRYSIDRFMLADEVDVAAIIADVKRSGYNG